MIFLLIYPRIFKMTYFLDGGSTCYFFRTFSFSTFMGARKTLILMIAALSDVLGGPSDRLIATVSYHPFVIVLLLLIRGFFEAST